MRGKLSDQDLTNYALNDGLEPHERLYVESMLAVSQECRDDIYRNIELAQMLETGFEKTYGGEAPMLTAEQREKLLHPPERYFVPMDMVRKTVATLAIAACVAFAVVNPHFWQVETHRRSLATVSSHLDQMVNTMSASADYGIAPLVSLPKLSDEIDSLMQTASEALPQASAMCTPPSLETSDFIGDIR